LRFVHPGKRRRRNFGHWAEAVRTLIVDASARAVFDDRFQGGVNQVPGPLTIGVTLGGLFLDVIAPRPKPRSGLPTVDLSSRHHARVEDTAAPVNEEHDVAPVVGGMPL
jgi:hypothetical protein